MSVEERDMLKKLIEQTGEMNGVIKYVHECVSDMKKRIKELEQENEDLKGQLKQFGLDLANKGEKRGLFLK